jgi:hypothetical protein
VLAHGVLHAQVAFGKHVGLVEGKHLQHLGRPAAHAFYGGEVLGEGFLGEAGEVLVVEQAALVVLGNGFEVAGFLAREAGGA